MTSKKRTVLAVEFGVWLQLVMHACLANISMLADMELGAGEWGLILVIIAILFFSRRFPDLWQGFNPTLFHIRKSLKDVGDELDLQAFDAGKSVGGVYGKPAAQALTPDNRTAELYDPAVFRKNEEAVTRIRSKKRLVTRGILLAVIIGLSLVILMKILANVFR